METVHHYFIMKKHLNHESIDNDNNHNDKYDINKNIAIEINNKDNTDYNISNNTIEEKLKILSTNLEKMELHVTFKRKTYKISGYISFYMFIMFYKNYQRLFLYGYI